MPADDQCSSRLSAVGEIELDGWRRIETDADTIELVSENRKDKFVIKSVSLSNDEVPHGYLIEYYEGDEPYANRRRRQSSIIATDPERVTIKARELLAECRDSSQG